MDSKKRGRPRKRRCDSSDCPIPLAVRRLDVGQRNETLFSERTHPHRDSSHNSSQNYINRSINLRIVNNNKLIQIIVYLLLTVYLLLIVYSLSKVYL
jgi:hypothetical protein